jgi:hypothetical protein
LGEEGWEMVNAFPVEAGGTLQYLEFIFKRPKPAANSPADPPPASDESLADQAGSSADAPAEPGAEST